MKYILVHRPQLTRNHNLLTVLLCTSYLVFRTNGLPIKFNEIVTAFQQINRLRPAEYKRLVNEIEVQAEDGPTHLNIIEFYNRLFLPGIKEHLARIEQWYGSHDAGTTNRWTPTLRGQSGRAEARSAPRDTASTI